MAGTSPATTNYRNNLDFSTAADVLYLPAPADVLYMSASADVAKW